MGKLKAYWQKTDIPKSIKVELWRIMRDNLTFDTFHGQVSKRYDEIFKEIKKKDKFKYGFFSRDTYNALKYEITHMPLEEQNTLPDDLRVWVKGLRGERKPSFINEVDMHKHWDELSKVASQISERFREIHRYYPPTDEKVGELAVDYDKPEFLELLDDPQAKWLLSHMKAEFPNLANLKTWADLRVKDITEELLDRLSLRAAKKEFKGSCEVCEGWE